MLQPSNHNCKNIRLHIKTKEQTHSYLQPRAQPGGGIWGMFPAEIFKTLHGNFDICSKG